MCGLIGLLGLAAAIFNGIMAEEFSFELRHIAMAFAFFIFVSVAISGTNPLDRKTDKHD